MKRKSWVRINSSYIAVSVLLMLLLCGLWLFTNWIQRYAMFARVENVNGNFVELRGTYDTPTSRAYWFVFPSGEMPAIGENITIDYGFVVGGPHQVNCWSKGYTIWMVVGMNYVSCEKIADVMKCVEETAI